MTEVKLGDLIRVDIDRGAGDIHSVTGFVEGLDDDGFIHMEGGLFINPALCVIAVLGDNVVPFVSKEEMARKRSMAMHPAGGRSKRS